MPLAPPHLTLSVKPDGFSPVNAPIYFAFTASFAGSTGITNSSVTIIDLQILDQNFETATVIDNPGRFKVPPRGDTYLYSPSDILKTYVTFPFDSKSAPYYVNENTGYGATFGSGYPCFSPDIESVVRYQLGYGLEYDPNFDFLDLGSVTGSPGGYTKYASIGVNYFCAVGDIINIQMDSDLYSAWNGTASVLAIGDSGFDTFVTTDQIVDADGIALILASGGIIKGTYTSVQHMVGTSSFYYGYNGTMQWYEKNIAMGGRYVLYGGSYSKSFLTDYGYDSNHCLQIKPNQGERARFLWDFYGDTPQGYTSPSSGLSWNIGTYDSNMVFLGTTSNSFGLGMSGSLFPQKCYTVQVFDSINTIPIIDGYKYNFQLVHLIVGGLIRPPYVMAELWFKGIDQPSKYDNYRIKFLNAQGSWNYWNFNKDSQQTINIDRTEYQRPVQWDYTLDTSASNYSTTKLRGQAVLSSNVINTFTLNSDWISEDDYKFLGQLIKSPEVYYYYDNDTVSVLSAELSDTGYPISGTTGTNIPLIMTDSSYTFKTVNRDKLFNLTITFKYAFDTNLQNQ